MAREMVIEMIENLAMSQGFYGRLLRYLEDVREIDPDTYEEIMSELEKCSGPVDLIMALEG